MSGFDFTLTAADVGLLWAIGQMEAGTPYAITKVSGADPTIETVVLSPSSTHRERGWITGNGTYHVEPLGGVRVSVLACSKGVALVET